MVSWNTLYQPKSKDEMIVGKHNAKLIDDFVKQFSVGEIAMSSLLIIGPNGTGKSMIAKMILESYGYEIGSVDLEDLYIREGKIKAADVKRTSDICWYSEFAARKRLTYDGTLVERKMALICDDANNISKPKNKECLKSIIRLNNKFKAFPIIIIANCKHNKLFSEIRSRLTYDVNGRKVINEIKIISPLRYEVKNLWNHIIKDQKMNIDNTLFDIIYDHSACDIRRFISIMEELHDIYKSDYITYEMFCDYQDTFDTKIVDMGIYHSSSALLNRYDGVDNTLNLFSKDRSNLPLMIHENYTRTVHLKGKDNSLDQAQTIFKVSQSLSMSDRIDGLTYSKSCWSLQNAYGFYSCVIPSYVLSNLPKKCNRITQTVYTQDFYKTTTKKNNQKNIRRLKSFPECMEMSNEDLMFAANILKELLVRNEYEKVAELIEHYKLENIKDFGLLIKVDKIKTPSNYLWKSEYLKRRIKQMLNEGKDIKRYSKIFNLTPKQLVTTINQSKMTEVKYLPTGKQGSAFETMLKFK